MIMHIKQTQPVTDAMRGGGKINKMKNIKLEGIFPQRLLLEKTASK